MNATKRNTRHLTWGITPNVSNDPDISILHFDCKNCGADFTWSISRDLKPNDRPQLVSLKRVVARFINNHKDCKPQSAIVRAAMPYIAGGWFQLAHLQTSTCCFCKREMPPLSKGVSYHEQSCDVENNDGVCGCGMLACETCVAEIVEWAGPFRWGQGGVTL